mgnify:CR=1 FL=1
MNVPELTKEQLLFLQNILTEARAEWFNKFEDSHTNPHLDEETCYDNYITAKELRRIFFHLGNRDTLAIDGRSYHEQRLDQGHDW